jgi:hypothetical protein
MRQHDYRVSVYLQGLAALAREVAGRPALLPWFVQILLLLPRTLRELEQEHESRRLAA